MANRLLVTGFRRLGYTPEYLTRMCEPLYGDRYLFKDEDRLLLALKRAYDAGSKICILPDFDMDGIAAGCILYAGLSLMGFDPWLYEPDTQAGYGIGQRDIDELLRKQPGTSIILTCDVGIGAEDAIAYAVSKGLAVYVTDHHPEKSRTAAGIIVDPSRMDEPSGFKGVCGAYVAWHLLTRYSLLACGPEVQMLIRKLSVFACLGSVGDSMPVTHDTRDAITSGLKEFNGLLRADDMDEYFGVSAESLPDAFAAPFENLRQLHFHMAQDGKVPFEKVDHTDIGFKYCPMFNSFKRMGSDIGFLYRYMYTRRDIRDGEGLRLREALLDLNDRRKKLGQDLYAKLSSDPGQTLAPYIYICDAFSGMLGPIASRMMSSNGLPCLVLRRDGDVFRGSGRTPAWFEGGFGDNGIFTGDGVQADGHEHAFGIYADEGALRGLRDAMAKASKQGHTAVDYSKCVRVAVNGHSNGKAADLSLETPDDYDTLMDYTREVRYFEPFGEGLEEPMFLMSFNKNDVVDTRLMGGGKQHLKLDMGHGVSAVWFNGAGFLDRLNAAPARTVFTIYGKPSINEFRGNTSLQFMIENLVQ